MRVAIIGGGIGGLASAWMAKDRADVVLYERSPWLGGHARTIAVEADGVTVSAESGFKYLFAATHRRVLALLRVLGVATRGAACTASIAFPDDWRIVLPPRSAHQVLALARHRIALRGAAALLRVWIEAALRDRSTTQDLASYLGVRFGRETIDRFLIPFYAASWGLPPAVIRGFAAYDVVKVLGNAWSGYIEIAEGVSRYIAALVAELDGVELRTRSPVRAIRRDGHELVVEADDTRRYDHVVLAVPAEATTELLATMPEAEPLRAVTAQFRYEPTEIVIHRDASWMPPERDAWSLFHLVLDHDAPFATEWCGLRARREVFRSWMIPGRAAPRDVVHRESFRHLVVTPGSLALQPALERLQGRGDLSLAGMYVTDVDVHESALASAVRVARMLAPSSKNLRRLERAL